jgi:hypothetical protein
MMNLGRLYARPSNRDELNWHKSTFRVAPSDRGKATLIMEF